MKGNIAIMDRLRDTSGVYSLIGGSGTSARVTPLFGPQTKIFPRILVELTDSTPIDSKSGAAEMDIDFVSVMSEARTYSDARELADACRTALDWQAGLTLNDIYCTRIRFISESDYRESIVDAPIYGIDQTYEVITYVT